MMMIIMMMTKKGLRFPRVFINFSKSFWVIEKQVNFPKLISFNKYQPFIKVIIYIVHTHMTNGYSDLRRYMKTL